MSAGTSTKLGRIGPTSADHSSISSESPMTHFSADAMPRTSSRHVSMLAMNSAMIVAATSSPHVRIVAERQCDQMSEAPAQMTYAIGNDGSRRQEKRDAGSARAGRIHSTMLTIVNEPTQTVNPA